MLSVPYVFDRGELRVAPIFREAIPEPAPVFVAVEDLDEVPIPRDVLADVRPQLLQREAVAVVDLLARDPGDVGKVGVRLAHAWPSSAFILPRRRGEVNVPFTPWLAARRIPCHSRAPRRKKKQTPETSGPRSREPAMTTPHVLIIGAGP